MNKETLKKNRKRNLKKKSKNRCRKNIIIFLIFELLFTAITAPFVLLYGPFENAKKIYVSSAMTSLSHQYLVKAFISDEKIQKILGKDVQYDDNMTTNMDEINIPSIKSDIIELEEITGNPRYEGYLMIIKDPTRVKIGITSKLDREGETTSQIAENNNAVAAINGGGFEDKSSESEWTGNGGSATGLIIQNGKVILDKMSENNSSEAVFGITKEGKMIVGKYTCDKLLELGVQEALSFHPALIINGKKMDVDSVDGGGGLAPRTAIGQRKEDGAILLLVLNGKGIINRAGPTYKELQEVMEKCGAYNALNLDGGKSTTMYYNGEVINDVSDSMGERPIPTAVIVK